MSSSSVQPDVSTWKPRVKVWLELDKDYAFGSGISRILKAVDESGSIKQAAEGLGRSYRYVWGRIKQAEATTGITLVETKVGGAGVQRSALTEEALELVHRFTALRSRLLEVVEEEFTSTFRVTPHTDEAGTSDAEPSDPPLP